MTERTRYFLVRIALAALFLLVSMWLKRCAYNYRHFDRQGLERPGTYLTEAEDSGEDLPPDAVFGVWSEDYMGKRVRFIAQWFFPNMESYQDRYLYTIVESVQRTRFVLVDDGIIPECVDEGYFRVEGYITGHRVEEIEGGTRTLLMVRPSRIAKIPDEDVTATIFPALSSAEPGIAVSGGGVTLTLLRVDYCADMTRFYCRVDNGGDGAVSVSRQTLSRDGKKLSTATSQWP